MFTVTYFIYIESRCSPFSILLNEVWCTLWTIVVEIILLPQTEANARLKIMEPNFKSYLTRHGFLQLLASLPVANVMIMAWQILIHLGKEALVSWFTRSKTFLIHEGNYSCLIIFKQVRYIHWLSWLMFFKTLFSSYLSVSCLFLICVGRGFTMVMESLALVDCVLQHCNIKIPLHFKLAYNSYDTVISSASLSRLSLCFHACVIYKHQP